MYVGKLSCMAACFCTRSTENEEEAFAWNSFCHAGEGYWLGTCTEWLLLLMRDKCARTSVIFLTSCSRKWTIATASIIDMITAEAVATPQQEAIAVGYRCSDLLFDSKENMRTGCAPFLHTSCSKVVR